LLVSWIKKEKTINAETDGSSEKSFMFKIPDSGTPNFRIIPAQETVPEGTELCPAEAFKCGSLMPG
jgi:hypothetical protein